MNEKISEIADFIYTSMCIDGFVKFDSFVDEIERHGEKLNGILFEVTDKKRGKFYISWLYGNGRNIYGETEEEKINRIKGEEYSNYGHRAFE